MLHNISFKQLSKASSLFRHFISGDILVSRNVCNQNLFRGNLSKSYDCHKRAELNFPFKYSSLATNFISHDEKTDFDSVLPVLIKDLTDASKSNDLPEVHDWFSKVLQYNISGGKNIRGLNVVFSYKLLAENLNAENIRLSYILGWCVEMLQGFFLVIDDIMDESETRRGLPAWYRLEEVGRSVAINDGLLIESGIYKILKLYFKKQPYYLELIDLFHDTTLKTLYGQGLDLMAAKRSLNRDFVKFTPDNYDCIIKYKTAYYTFHLPVALALYMAGITDDEIHAKSKDVLLDIGRLFQIQDDYLDCFGEFSQTGKIGSDIREGKCTWLSVNCLQVADDRQIQLFLNNYGYGEQEKINIIKQLYTDLKIPNLYKEYEEEMYDKIIKNIHDIRGVPREIFTNLLKIVFKREK